MCRWPAAPTSAARATTTRTPSSSPTSRTASVAAVPRCTPTQSAPRGSLFMVADGMGGAAAGEIASAMAAETILEHLLTTWIADPRPQPERFAFRVREARRGRPTRQIHAYAEEHPEVRGMGTTATAAGVLRRPPLPRAGGRQPRLPGPRRRGPPAHQGPVAHAAAGRRGRAHRGGGREERAPQHHPPGARPRRRRSRWTSPTSSSAGATCWCSAPTG